MNYQKKKLLLLAKNIESRTPLTPEDITYILGFEKNEHDNSFIQLLKSTAFPAAVIVGALFAIFPSFFDNLATQLPWWTNFSPQILAGIDYMWNFLGEPIGKPNIIYHLPNIVLYTFGIAGIKALIDSIEQKTWIEKVLQAQTTLRNNIQQGQLNLKMKKGHSLLFVGKGDFIGMQFTLNQPNNETVTISQNKPQYTDIWNFYDVSTLYEDMKHVLSRCSAENAGEYIFFPVKDDQIFLPSETAYDLSPHKIDIICQNIRTLEKELRWETKRILIIGDKFHKSFVQSEDQEKVIQDSEDIISLDSICHKYKNVSLLDPTDVVLKKILDIAHDRKIVFRATKEGIKEYKQRFYNRLNVLGYNEKNNEKGILTIGYDIFEDQTEQQTLCTDIDDYFPVVLSKNVRDALIRNGYKENEFLYVPELVLSELDRIATEQ